MVVDNTYLYLFDGHGTYNGQGDIIGTNRNIPCGVYLSNVLAQNPSTFPSPCTVCHYVGAVILSVIWYFCTVITPPPPPPMLSVTPDISALISDASVCSLFGRFKDVLPYEDNRVRVTPSRDNPFGYINASHISVSRRQTAMAVF